MRILVSIVIVFCSFKSVFCQQSVLRFNFKDSKETFDFPDSIFQSKKQALNKLDEYYVEMIDKGFLLFSYDSIVPSDSLIYCYVSVGEKFNKASLSVVYDKGFNSNSVLKIKDKKLKEDFTPKELSIALKSLKSRFLNEGYPFVSLKLENQKLDSLNNLIADIKINPGPLFRWKKITIKGDSSISKKYISELLSIKVGKRYDESLLSKISLEISQLIFIEEIKPHEVLYTADGVELFLYLKSKPSSSINGAIGLQPDITTDKYRLAGELTAQLTNLLKRGEQIKIKWQGLRPQTQSFFANANIPFLFNTPFGLGGDVLFYKRDTSFLEIKSNFNVQYFLGQGFYLKGIYQFYNNQRLQTAASNGQNYSSITSNSYGLSINKKKIDYLPNPSRGFILNTNFSLGNRGVSDSLNQESSKSIYLKTQFNLEFFVPFFKRHIAHFSLKGEQVQSEGLYENELTRFGGLNSLRGFNEEELFSSANLCYLIEYRFLVDRNSNAFVFFNQSWYENNANQSYYNDMPYGLGVGYSFGSKLGVFSVIYAIGKQMDNPFELRNGKLHVGYTSYF